MPYPTSHWPSPFQVTAVLLRELTHTVHATHVKSSLYATTNEPIRQHTRPNDALGRQQGVHPLSHRYPKTHIHPAAFFHALCLMFSRPARLGFVMKRKLSSFLKDPPTQSALPSVAATSPSFKKHAPTGSVAPLNMVTASIQLNAREEQLRRLLLDVAKSIDEGGHAKEPIVLRWAGGWVRDRLLDIESHDIDVAINAMTGVPFAERMCDYCETPEAITKHGIGPDDIGSLHNVARNPDKSKHLETAMVKMFGLDLDFVNLRKETYTEDSRNPQMEFGTAEEDALRRDATINALFYNLHTDRVEDLTGGLEDMASKVIRTPLEPYQTFMDDPLRVLRLVRFASRLQFDIDSTTRRFMSNERVLEALRVKISRERVGVELEKMLRGMLRGHHPRHERGTNSSSGAHPRDSLKLIDGLKLYSAIFTDPAQETMTIPDISKWEIAYEYLESLIRDKTPGSIGEVLLQNEEATYSAWNLAALSPWMTIVDPPNPNRKLNAPPPVSVVAREGFRAPNKLTDITTASYRHRLEIMQLKQAVCNRVPYINERDRFGMAIRGWDTPMGSWRLQVLNAMLVEALEVLPGWSKKHEKGKPFLTRHVGSRNHTLTASVELEEFTAGWRTFLDHLATLEVMDAPSLKRLLDGRQLAKALGIRPGIWTGKALDVCVAWQLRNPEEKDPAGAIEELRQRSRELEIPSP